MPSWAFVPSHRRDVLWFSANKKKTTSYAESLPYRDISSESVYVFKGKLQDSGNIYLLRAQPITSQSQLSIMAFHPLLIASNNKLKPNLP